MHPIRRTLALASCLLVASIGLAQQDPALERGFSAEKAYQIGEIDHVNLFNGNLMLTIPIGGSYPINAGLEYGFVLVYNGNIWDYKSVTYPNDPNVYTEANLSPTFNAGAGFNLSLGRLLAPGQPGNSSGTLWEYVAPDGSEHAFVTTLHEDEPVNSSFSYTRDGSYLRMKVTLSTQREVQFPDGSARRFVNSGGTWRLTRIYDLYGNYASVDYLANTPSAGWTTWQIGDTHGRTHAVELDESGVVKFVKLQTVGGALATYTFNYLGGSIYRSCRDTAINSDTVYVKLLTSVTLPDESSWSGFNYNSGSECPTIPKDESGTLYGLNLPTGGRLEWTYQDYELTSCTLSSTKPPMPTYTITGSAGLYTKSSYGAPGPTGARPLLGTWTYEPHTHYSSDAWGCDFADERILKVVDPQGNATLSTFWAKNKDWDYGLPYTRLGGVTDPGGRFLSQRSYRGDPEVYCEPVPDGTPCTITLGPGIGVERSTWLRYEHDKIKANPSSSDKVNTNRRVASQRQVFDTDGSRDIVTDSFDFDGLGHYRTTVTAGHADFGPIARSKTATNSWMGTYKLAADNTYDTVTTDPYAQFPDAESPGHTYPTSGGWATRKEWILETYDSQRQDHYDTEQDPALSTAMQVSCFEKGLDAYPTKPFMKARRTYANGASAGTTDVVALFARDNQGNLTNERSYGGDVQAVGSALICSWTAPGPEQYRVLHEYPSWNGSVWNPIRRTYYVRDTGASVGFNTVDLDVDRFTGLVTASRDTAGRATAFEYDAMNRLAWEKPAAGNNGAWTEYAYHAWAWPDLAWVDAIKHPNGSTTGVLAEQRYRFDGLGRLVAEEGLLADGLNFNQRLTSYDAMGWKTAVTEWQPRGTPEASLRQTLFAEFDPFGRPGRITPPDGSTHDVTLAYTGVRVTDRAVKVAQAGGEAPVTTAEVSDRFGRLAQVTEDSGVAPNLQTTTTYRYDVGGRLKQASTTSGVTQTRLFTYDGRGFLLSEDIPEKTIPAGFSHDVTYASYDARGHALRITDGPNDLAFTYDRAERVTEVREATGEQPRVLRSFEYDTIDGNQGSSLGKLVRSTGSNYFNPDPTINFQVKETLTYNGRDGRVSARLTEAGDTRVPLNVFPQAFEYSQLGAVSSLTYPNLSGTTLAPSRLVSNAREYGYLTGVSDGSATYALDITYHPNGLIDTLTHGNGVMDVHGKDPNDMRRPLSITAQQGSTVHLETGAYAYDGAGNIKSMGADTFTYDRVSRLVKGSLASIAWQQCASFDAFGNITGLANVATGATCTPSTISVDAATNRLTTASYDAAGEQQTWGSDGLTFTYGWYPTGQMRQMSDESGRWTLYGYGADGERLVWYDSVENALHYTLRDLSGKVLREYAQNQLDFTWSWKKDYVYRDGLLLATIEPPLASPVVKHVHLDHLGNVRRLTNPAGAVVGARDFLPFGQLHVDTAPTERLAFTAHKRDLRDPVNTTDDLDDMHARYYNPNIARFLCTDPVLQVKKAMRQPQRWNRYSYAVANPIVYTDPTGETVYLVMYTAGNTVGDDGFRRAAYQLATELRNTKGFDSNKDRVLVRGVTTKDDIAAVLKEARSMEKAFGKVGEFSLFSHAGPLHGPTLHDARGEPTWFTASELRGLDVKWGAGASARFYGCNTAVNFTQHFADYQGVKTGGYDDSALFSSRPDRWVDPQEAGPSYLIQTENSLKGMYFGGGRAAVPMHWSNPTP